MWSVERINKRITDLQSELTPDETSDINLINTSKISTLCWVANYNKLRTAEELQNKIKRIKEEMLPFTNKTDINYLAKQGCIDELRIVQDFN